MGLSRGASRAQSDTHMRIPDKQLHTVRADQAESLVY